MLKSLKTGARWILVAAALPVAHAAAQIGGSAVSISSPPPGARVDGSVTVVGTSGDFTVSGVQFLLDGYELGAEDPAPPFEVPWDSRASSDGWHTLRALTRTVFGTRVASEPVSVRVSNVAPPPMPVLRYEDSSPNVGYGFGWTPRNPNDWLAWSGSSAMQSLMPGAQATFSFSGTSVAWIGYRSDDSGIARILVDGNFVAEIDLFARRHEVTARVFSVGGLDNSNHVLTIEVTGRKNADATLGNIVIDAFDVPALPVTRLQDSDPGIEYAGDWVHLGGWFADTTLPWSDGTASISAAAGDRATLTFSGTSIAWIGLRDTDTGIARVFLDGVPVGSIDTYSASTRIQDTIYAVKDLAEGIPHTLTIEATGLSNEASSGTSIVIDAFEIGSTGERFQETDWSVTYTGAWTSGNRNRAWSEGTAAVAQEAGGRATFRFTGSAVSWIGFRAARTGIARVYVDDVFVAEVDTYAPVGEGFQNTLYAVTGLAHGQHTLTIEATGRSNPAATSNYIVIDAFDVRR